MRGELRLSKRKLYAIIDALNFCLADDWDADSHDERGDHDGTLLWAQQELAKREKGP